MIFKLVMVAATKFTGFPAAVSLIVVNVESNIVATIKFVTPLLNFLIFFFN
jgi:hypothetical protein